MIADETSKSETYSGKIINIINVLTVMKKIDDYAARVAKSANIDKENIDL